jgi:hypothetical protein
MTGSIGSTRVTQAMSGWVRCAAILLLLAGGFNLIHGFVALDHERFVTKQIAVGNLTFWGIVFLVWGAAEIFAGVSVLGRRLIGYYVGVLASGSAMVLWFLMTFSAPFAAILGVLVNMAILYGLTVGAADDWS